MYTLLFYNFMNCTIFCISYENVHRGIDKITPWYLSSAYKNKENGKHLMGGHPALMTDFSPWLCCRLYFGMSWWRHDMETLSALLALCWGNPPVTGAFASQNSSTHGTGTEIRYQDPSALPWSKMATATTGKDVYTVMVRLGLMTRTDSGWTSV